MDSGSRPQPSPLEAAGFEPMNAPWLFDDQHVQRGRFAAPEKKKKRKSKLLPVLSGLVIAGTIAGAVYAGVRLDNQQVDPEPPTASEQARQDLAVQAHRLGAYALALKDSGPAFGDLAEHASSWEKRLGGVWVPWPDGKLPADRTNPPLQTEAPSRPDPADLLSDLTEFSASVLADASSHEGALREEFVRMSLDAKLLAARVAEASGAEIPSAGEVDYAAVAAVAAGTEQMNAIEEARQWLEREATQSPAGAVPAVDARIDALNAVQDELIQAGIEDTRAAVVPFPELADGESLTSLALERVSSSFLPLTASASADQMRAVVGFLYSLYQNDAERAAAGVLK